MRKAKGFNGKGKLVATNEHVKHGLTAGRLLPKGCGWIILLSRRFQHSLVAAVKRQRAEIGQDPDDVELTLWELAAIQTCVRWERHAVLSQRWMRVHDDLKPMELLHFSREVCRASNERDKCMRSLGLDAGLADTYAGLYGDEPDDGEERPARPLVLDVGPGNSDPPWIEGESNGAIETNQEADQ